MYDIIIIGAGPAGVSAAIYAVSRGKNTLVIEKDKVGGLIGRVSTVTHYAAIVEQETGQTFAARLKAQAISAGVQFSFEEVQSVKLGEEIKQIVTKEKHYEAKRVILANGTTPKKLDIPGEQELDGKGIGLNAARDAKQYIGKQVFVVGGADGAVKEALYLSLVAEKVTIIHFEEKLGAIPEFAKKVAAADNIEVCLNSRLTAVFGERQVEQLEITEELTGNKRIITAPECGIFVYAGSVPNTELYKELSLKEGFVLVDEKMQTSIPGVFAAGDIIVKQVRQVATAVSEGAIAAINAALD